jgi:hypothetical protein
MRMRIPPRPAPFKQLVILRTYKFVGDFLINWDAILIEDQEGAE